MFLLIISAFLIWSLVLINKFGINIDFKYKSFSIKIKSRECEKVE